jgi:O-antigen/teichoic acid export membrane protein
MALMQAGFRILAIREAPVAEYGQAALLISVFNVVLVLGHFGIPVAAARLAARRRGKGLATGMVGAAARAAALPALAGSFAIAVVTAVVTSSAGLALVALVGMLPMVVSVIAAGFLRGKGRIWESASVQPANAAIQLVVLAALIVGGANIGVGSVLVSFYAGNVGAAVVGVALLRRVGTVRVGPVLDSGVRDVLRFSAWLTIATFAIYALTLLPRISMAHVSYEQVALLDLALLVYSIPQRLVASFLTALVPLAAGVQARRERVTVPAALDAAVFLFAFSMLAIVLWQTHAVRHALAVVVPDRYLAAEPLVLVLLAAVPAEALFAVNSGFLQGFGETRRLAATSWGVLVGMAGLLPIAVWLGPAYVAGVIVIAYWSLYIASRALLRLEQVQERSVVLRALPNSAERAPA